MMIKIVATIPIALIIYGIISNSFGAVLLTVLCGALFIFFDYKMHKEEMKAPEDTDSEIPDQISESDLDS